MEFIEQREDGTWWGSYMDQPIEAPTMAEVYEKALELANKLIDLNLNYQDRLKAEIQRLKDSQKTN